MDQNLCPPHRSRRRLRNLKQSVGENTNRDNLRLVGRTAISLLHTLAMVHYNLRRITKLARENSLSVEAVYAATSEEELLSILQTETDPAVAKAPTIESYHAHRALTTTLQTIKDHMTQ